MIKVINIISDSNIGGAGRCIINFLKYYDADKFEIVVILPEKSLLIPELLKLKIKYIEASHIAEKSFDKNAVKILKKIIKEEKADVVHTHGNLSGRIAAKLCGCKIIYTRHSVFPVSKKISRGLGKFVNKSLNEFLSDDIIAVAEAAKDNLTEGGIAANKIKVILNGVEKVPTLCEQEIFEVKKSYDISEEDFTIGIIARIEHYKGHKYLIEATEILLNKGFNIKTLIVGTGDYLDTLKDLVKDKKLEKNVLFTGFLSNVTDVLNILDIQINASFGTEATSLSLLEGMSLGIPAVVSDYGGNPGVITSGENGYIFKKQQSEDLAYYVEKIISDNDLFLKLKAKSFEIYENKFTARIYAKNIGDVYKKLVDEVWNGKKW